MYGVIECLDAACDWPRLGQCRVGPDFGTQAGGSLVQNVASAFLR